MVETIIRFFSYFTILTNSLVALCFTVLIINRESGWGRFFSNSKTLAALTVYICVVGIIYNTVLRQLWAPQGLQLVVDELLHSVNPGGFILYWFMFAPKDNLKWTDAFSWLIYPFVYLLYVLTLGVFFKFYPYPFIDVNNIGFYKVALNSGAMMIVFMLISILFISVSKVAHKG